MISFKKFLLFLTILITIFSFLYVKTIETSNNKTLLVTYDRNAAVNYAYNYYNKVCEDGFYSLVYKNNEYEPSDCAHFVSWALSKGGINIPDNTLCNKIYKGFTSSKDLSIWLY